MEGRFLKISAYIFGIRLFLLNFASVIKLNVMRGKIRLMLMALVMASCSGRGIDSDPGLDSQSGRNLSHEKIVLGARLENPYKTENITKALSALYPTKADRVQVRTTDLYVRFLPEDEQQLALLEGLRLTDHPLDYEILEDGDWYHDPEVADDKMTWQYAVVPHDYVFPEIEYEIIDECHISENDSGTRSGDDIDWEAVERHSYLMTGNEGFLIPDTKAEKVSPSGRITIVDEKAGDGKSAGVKGVRVSCNSFVRFAHAYTDDEGYYKMDKKFSSKLRYRLVFENSKGFSIGFNMILAPASTSTLGQAGPDGVNASVTDRSESKLFKRCAVNNAAYDYYSRCEVSDLNLALPPKDLRIWLFHKLQSSSSMMMHHGAFLDMDLVSSFLGDFAPLVQIFLPDLTIGVKGRDDYASIYSEVCHELAHASHFSKVGTDYWNRYILYVMGSFVSSGGMAYGDGSGVNAGYCEVGEMWAYYLSARMYHDRYGGDYPPFGTTFWFYPQILRYVEEKGLECWEIFSLLDASVNSRETLRRAMIAYCPDKADEIELIFNRYMRP